MRIATYIPVLALMLSAFTASAQFSSTTPGTTNPPSTTPSMPTPSQQATHQVKRLTTLLTLTSDQQTQATTIFTTEYTTLSGLRTSLKTAHTSLTTAVEANDANGISSAATTIGGITTQQVVAEGTADAAFRAILTSDQQTKYDELLTSGFGFGGHGGFDLRGGHR